MREPPTLSDDELKSSGFPVRAGKALSLALAQFPPHAVPALPPTICIFAGGEVVHHEAVGAPDHFTSESWVGARMDDVVCRVAHEVGALDDVVVVFELIPQSAECRHESRATFELVATCGEALVGSVLVVGHDEQQWLTVHEWIPCAASSGLAILPVILGGNRG